MNHTHINTSSPLRPTNRSNQNNASLLMTIIAAFSNVTISSKTNSASMQSRNTTHRSIASNKSPVTMAMKHYNRDIVKIPTRRQQRRLNRQTQALITDRERGNFTSNLKHSPNYTSMKDVPKTVKKGHQNEIGRVGRGKFNHTTLNEDFQLQGAKKKIYNRQKRTVRGDPVDIRASAHNSIVLLEADRGVSKGNSYCTGTVVGSRKVLTAAHCGVPRGQESNCVPVDKFDPIKILINEEEYKCDLKIPTNCMQVYVSSSSALTEHNDGDKGIIENVDGIIPGSKELFARSTDVMICQTDRDIKGVKPARMMAPDEVKAINFYEINQASYYNNSANTYINKGYGAPNKAPFPGYFFMGMGWTSTRSSIEKDQECEGLNIEANLNVGWLNASKLVHSHGREEYEFVSYFTDDKGRGMPCGGDSGGPIFGYSWKDYKYKLVSLVSSGGEEDFNGAVIYKWKLDTQSQRTTNLTELTRWLDSEILQEQTAITDFYDPLLDPWLPEPPMLVPFERHNLYNKSHSIAFVDPTYEPIPENALKKPTDIKITSNVKDVVLVEVKGKLFTNNTLVFQYKLEPNETVIRSLPVGFKPEEIIVSSNNSCIAKDLDPSVAPKLKDIPITIELSSTNSTELKSNADAFTGTEHNECTVKQEYDSPFRLKHEKLQLKTIPAKKPEWQKAAEITGLSLAGLAGAALIGVGCCKLKQAADASNQKKQKIKFNLSSPTVEANVEKHFTRPIVSKRQRFLDQKATWGFHQDFIDEAEQYEEEYFLGRPKNLFKK